MHRESNVAEERVDDEVLEDVLREAAALGDDGRWDEARDTLREALEDAPEEPALLCWLGIASQRTGRDGEAYEYFRRCLAQQPADPFLLAACGNGLAVLDDPEAESVLRLAAVAGPELPFARASYGAYLAREGLFDEALAELEAARTLAPDDGGIRTELASALLLAGRTEPGLAELEEALAVQGDDPWLRGLYGLVLLTSGRNEEAAEELHRVSGERPADVEVQLLYALASAGEGWEDEAWSALARAEAGADAMDRDLIQEVEERIEEGEAASLAFLRDELAPTLLRERLLHRA